MPIYREYGMSTGSGLSSMSALWSSNTQISDFDSARTRYKMHWNRLSDAVAERWGITSAQKQTFVNVGTKGAPKLASNIATK